MTAEIRAELQALQEQVDRLASDNARLSRTEELDLIKLRELNGRNQVLTDKLRGDMVWIEKLRARCERLEAAIGGIAEYDRPENNFTIHPNWRDAFFELVKIAKRTLEK